MQQEQWLPLTEYALRTGISISTLRRKIKTNSVEYRMDAGKYLIRCDRFDDEIRSSEIDSQEAAAFEPLRYSSTFLSSDASVVSHSSNLVLKASQVEEQLQQGELKWRAMEARVSGLAKKIEMFSEQISELKMLVKIFEEKLDNEIQ